MGHEGAPPTRFQSLAARAAFVFLVCALAGYWLAPKHRGAKPVIEAAIAAKQSAAGGKAELTAQIQQLLAQGGCPGWIELAGDPHALDAPPNGVNVYSGPLRETSARDFASQPPAAVQLTQAEDDLISEDEDLLYTSPEVQGRGDSAATTPPAETPPADDSLTEPAAEPRQYAPQELLREKPLAAQEDAPPPAASAQDPDDLLNGVDDLLNDQTVPPPAEPLPAQPQQQLLPPQDQAPQHASPPLPVPPQQSEDAGDRLDTTPVAPKPPAQIFTPPGGAAPAGAAPAANDPSRCQFVADQLYPPASACRACHEKIYEEWSMSSHAYSAVSPMFHKFEQKINDLSQGTIGYFCIRCHSPAGTALCRSRAAPMYDAPQVAREGVTCVACHRVREFYGKTNGERRIEPGDIYAPVYGTIGGDGVAKVAAEKANYKVKTSPHDQGPGQEMHAAAFTFPQLCKSEFCTSCHQVAVYPGIKLEVVWEQYRASPACKKGVSCQDCHMGRIPGVPSDYEYGPAALINNKSVHPNRKHANHVFYGPGYSIAHPGVYPWNPKAERWTMRQWLMFDWRAGWGTDAFEDAVADGTIHVHFPDPWRESDDRYDAREIIEANLKKRAVKDQLRAQVMENGSHVDGPFFEGPQQVGADLKFSFIVANTNEGHNLPTASLGAQPQLWANVVLIGPDGARLWETGYLDSNGDLADIHSEDVRHKRIAYDWQLFNLQTMFLITGAKGTDREFFLPINIDTDPLPFIRPAPQPVSVINHPPFIRMEARSLAPLGSRKVPYRVPGRLLCRPGRYRLSFRMRNRIEPPFFMRFCESTVEMQRAMIEGTLDFHQISVEFDVR